MDKERFLLGQILIDNSIYDSIIVKESDFSTLEHRKIFRAITLCLEKGIKADLISVMDQGISLNATNLSSLTNIVTTSNWQYYQKDILTNSFRRKLRDIYLHLGEWLEGDPYETITKLEDSLISITADDNMTFKTPAEIIPKLMDDIEQRYNAGGEIPGIKTGVQMLDKMLLGFRKRMSYIIGGRPSQGKSAAIMNFACHASIREGKRVGYISTESSTEEIFTRIFASEGNINSMTLITGKLQKKEFRGMIQASDKLQKANLYVYYKAGMKIDDVSRAVRKMVRVHKCDIVFIDYLQDIVLEGRETLAERTKEKSKTIKKLAEQMNIPIVSAAQLRRDAEGRRPKLSDFSDSSQIEKDADGAILIYHTEKEIEQYGTTVTKHNSYFLVEKARDGITGDIPIFFKKEYVKFTEVMY